ncbi:substrate-binding domain-containing protein [Puia sp. P3]|uniref:substrate-binding domain-containing protein n=1 Tax=Puia sp. P3 TaxID=3423952 RepID=UPI003D670108
MKISVPQQVALVGFTNSISADIFYPSLTAVTQPALEMGQAATDLLIQLIESKRPITQFQKKVLETELKIRDSSIRKPQ